MPSASFSSFPHLAQLQAQANLGEEAHKADVEHAWHFGIGWQCRSSHTAKELALHLATGGDWNAAKGAAAAAQARCVGLETDVAFQAQPGLLSCAADVVELGDASIVATAACGVHDHLGLIDGVHLNLPWRRHDQD